MDEKEGAEQVPASPPTFMTVNFAFDEVSQWLKAHVCETETDPKLTLPLLKGMLKEQGWEAFRVPDKALQDLMKRVESQEQGTFELAPKPTYAALQLEFDETTRFLTAILTESDQEQEITVQSLQALIKEQGFESFLVPMNTMQTIVTRAKNKEFGVFDLAKKPVYFDVELSYDESTRKVKARLFETEEELRLNEESIQSKMEALPFTHLELNAVGVQQVLKSAQQKKTGEFIVGEKPEFTQCDLVFDEENNELSIVLSACDDDPHENAETIQQRIESRNYNAFKFEPDYLAALEKNLETNQRGSWIIARRLDAEVIIEVADDEMKATLTTKPPYGGNRLSMVQLELTIKSMNIDLTLVDRKVLEEALKVDTFGPEIFVRGTVPEDGEDASFEPLVQSVITYAPEVDEKGRANFLQTRDYVIIEPGTPLMKRKPATPGKNGYDVFGKSVPAKPGEDTPFSSELVGACPDAQDPNQLIATMKGHPVVLEDGVYIDNILVMENVDLKTGNVSFDGSVFIKGKISSGMVVHVTGDVRVQEPLNNATIIAGHDIILESGIIGDKHESEEGLTYLAQLSAGRDIYANFITRTEVKAQRNIEVREYISHSHVAAEGKLIIGQEGGKGQLLGECAQAKRGAVLNILGASAHIKTELIVGYGAGLRLRHRELSAKKHEAETLFAQHHFAIHKIEHLDKMAEGEAKINKINLLKEELVKVTQEMDALTNQVEECEDQIASIKDACIKVMKTTYPNVVLEIGGSRCTVDEESGPAEYIRLENKVQKKV